MLRTGARLLGRTVLRCPPAPDRLRKPQEPRATLVQTQDSKVSGWPCRMFSRRSTSSRRPGRPPKPPSCRPGKSHPLRLMLKGSSFSSRTWESCPPPQLHTRHSWAPAAVSVWPRGRGPPGQIWRDQGGPLTQAGQLDSLSWEPGSGIRRGW